MLPVRPLFKALQQVRHYPVVAAPPCNPVTPSELLLHGSIIVVFMLSVPAYVTYRLPQWRDRNKA